MWRLRIGAISAVLGGSLWVAAVIGTTVGLGTADPVVAADALLLLISMAVLHDFQGRDSGFPGWAGIRFLVVGLSVLAAAFAGTILGVGASAVLAVPGLISAWVGVGLFAIGTYVARVMTPAVAALLIFGWVLVYGYNVTGISTLMVIPFGLAWILVGLNVRQLNPEQSARSARPR
jgi:hypothetical protein